MRHHQMRHHQMRHHQAQLLQHVVLIRPSVRELEDVCLATRLAALVITTNVIRKEGEIDIEYLGDM